MRKDTKFLIKREEKFEFLRFIKNSLSNPFLFLKKSLLLHGWFGE